MFEDDPSFLPELALPPPELLAELDHNFNLDIARSGDSQTLTPFGSQQTRSSSHADPIGGLVLPTSSPVMAAEFRLEGDDGVGSVGGRSTMLGAGETLELEDPDFMIGDSGEIIPFTPRRKVPRTPARTAGATMSGDAGASTRVRKEHEEGQQAGSQVSFAAFSHVFSHCNISPQSCGQTSLLSLEASDITPHYLTAIAQAQSIGWLWRLPVAVFAWCLFPYLCLCLSCFYFRCLHRTHLTFCIVEMATDLYQCPGNQEDIDLPTYDNDPVEGQALLPDGSQQSSEPSEVIESSDTFAAPMRRRRGPRTLPIDAATELPNKELAGWQKNYRQNMKAAARQKIQRRVAAQAKKNAEYYVWGAGIGGIGDRILSGQAPNPFDMFIGDNLFESMTGFSRTKVAGKKHDRDSGIDDATQEESRRVRRKSNEPEVGRSAGDSDVPMPDDDEIAVELPREGVSALDDQQIFSAMPWNISASIRGSSAVPRSGRAGLMGSADQSRPGSRFVSDSPSKGRGQLLALGELQHLTSDADYGGDEFGLPGFSSDFPEPAVQEPSVRVREALSTEGTNFLAFINERIVEKRTRAQADLENMLDVLQAEAAADIDEIAFEELLPPAENTKMIACQGFMMVLGLGTKGMLDVQQTQHLGEINVKLSEKAKAMQVIEMSDAEESNENGAREDDHAPGHKDADPPPGITEEQEAQDQDMQEQDFMEEEGGHFQEQFAAGHAAEEKDDHDSLYED
jgi:hypothetical protein